MTLTSLRKGRSLLRRFRKDRKGVTMIEFGFIALPFFMIVIGTLETALIHLSRSSLANAMDQNSRAIMTGSAGCLTHDELVARLCDQVAIGSNCTADTKIVMRELSSFRSSTGDSYDGDFDNFQGSVDMGSGGSIMLMRTYHRWNTIVPLMDRVWGDGNGEVVMINNIAFRNEPFSTSTGCST